MNTRRLLMKIFTVFVVLGSSFSYAEVTKVDSHFSLLSHKSANVAVAQKQGILKSVNGNAELLVSAIVRFQGNLDGVEALGCTVRSVMGDVATLDMPLSAVERVSQLPNIVHIESSKSLKHRLNTSVPATGANTLRSGTPPNWSGKTGKGVVIGIIDTGIDLNHKDFKNAAGKTRILSLWDQTVNGTHPAGYAKGNECAQTAIDAGSCTQKDMDGHGTHVAGIAAGNGSATGNGQPAYRYVGMAPEADLIVVKLDWIDTASVLDAITYIQSKAAALGKPSVVNMSFGSHYGPHDGTSSYERGLDNLSGAGKVIVAAAGNEAHDNIHASGYVYQGSNTTVGFSVPAGYGANLDIWYPGASQFGVSVSKGSCTTSIVNPGNTQTFQTACGRIDISSSAVNPNNGDREIVISLSNGNAPVSSGAWNFTLTGNSVVNGRFDVWSSDEVATFTSYADSSITLNDGATATKTIAVAAYTTKNTWQSINGYTYYYSGYPQVGAIASFSSLGPRRSCSDTAQCPSVQKPEITAPGMGIMSAKSAQISGLDQAWVDPDGVHLLAAGTSMAAPHVTGAVALILQTYPTLTSDQVKGMLTSSAKTDSYTDLATGFSDGSTGVIITQGATFGVPNNIWGYGKLDAAAAVAATPPIQVDIKQMNLATSDIIYDKFRGKIYASIPGRSTQYANSIAVINPETATVEAYVPIGNEPDKLAISDDGQFLYVGLSGEGVGSVRRLILSTLTPDLTFRLGRDSFFGSYFVDDMEVFPGNSTSVAISLMYQGVSPRHAGVAVYDDGVKRATQTPGHTGSNVIEFSESSETLYGLNTETTDFGLRTMSVTPSGLSITDVYKSAGLGWDMVFDGGLIYGTGGEIFDPVTRMVVGTLTGMQWGGPVRPDATTGRVYFLDNNWSKQAVLRAYDKFTYQPKGAIDINGLSGRPRGSLIRWGTQGLAFRTDGDQVFFIKTALIPEIDSTPNAFTFVSQNNLAVNTVTVSNFVTISGITTPSPISITGGEYSISGGTWTSAAGTVTNGQAVRVRLTSSASFSTTTTATLTIGGVSGTFSITTMAAPDTTPDAFSFSSRSLVPTNVQITSDPASIIGINAATSVNIVGGEYRIGEGAWTSAPGTITNGQIVRVRQTSSGSYNTPTTATLTIGGVSADFTLTTVAANTEVLHTAWWSISTGYTSYVMVQNITNNPVTVNAIFVGRNGVSYIPVPMVLSPRQARAIVINSSQANLLGAVNGAVEVAHDGNPGAVIADLMVFGSNGFSMSTALKNNTAVGTNLHAPWWCTYSGYTSYVMVKNTSSNSVTVDVTLIGRNDVSYTDSLTLAPHEARSILVNSYQANLSGAVNGAVELTHTGNPGDVVGDVLVFGPGSFSFSAGLKENVATSTNLHTAWWITYPGYTSYVMVKNTSNATITVGATLLGRNGVSYTPSLTLAPHQARSIVVNSYQAYLPGAVNGAVELTHTGNPGDVEGDLIVFGPDGFSLSTDLKENVATSTTLRAPWWSTNPGYTSYVMVKNTTNATVTVNATLLGRNGTSYTSSLTLAPHQARSIVINSYQANLSGAVNGAVEVTHSGNPGDVIGDLIVFGPGGFSTSAPLR